MASNNKIFLSLVYISVIALLSSTAKAVDIEFFFVPWEEGGPASGSHIAHNVVSAQCYGGPPPTEYYHIQFRGLLYNHWAQPFLETGATCTNPIGGSFGPGTYDYYSGDANNGPYLGSAMAITCPERGAVHYWVAASCEEKKRSLDDTNEWSGEMMPQKRNASESAEPTSCIHPDTLVWNGVHFTGGDVKGGKWVDKQGMELDQTEYQAYLGKFKKRKTGQSFQA